MPQSGTEVAGVKLVGGTDHGKGHDKWIERDRNRRR
jgi:hypothetical protein